MHQRVAGIDMHRMKHVVTIVIGREDGAVSSERREFEGGSGEQVSLDQWMRERLLPLPSLGEEERYARLRRWVGELPLDERLVFFKLITGELRVGVSRLKVVKALAEVASVDESRMAQRLIGYAQARRIPTAADFETLIGEVRHEEGERLDAGKPYPFFLAQSWSRPLADTLPALGRRRTGSSNGSSTASAPSFSSAATTGACGRAARS